MTREEAEQRRGFDPDLPPADRARNRSLFFDHLLDAKVREFNPRYAGAAVPSLGELAERGPGGILSPRVIIAFVILGLFPITVKKILAYVRSRRETAEELVDA